MLVSPSTPSDVQVPPLLLIIMSKFKIFRNMAPGRLTVYGGILQIVLMLVTRLPRCFVKNCLSPSTILPLGFGWLMVLL